MPSDKESDWEDVESEDDDVPDLEDQSDSEDLSTYSTENEGGEFDLEMPRLRHWSDIVFGHTHLLQHRIEDALASVFEATPSLALYSTLLSMAHDPRTLERRLLSSLKTMATSLHSRFQNSKSGLSTPSFHKQMSSQSYRPVARVW